MEIYGWTPAIGDPDTLGWLTVFAYLAAAIVAFAAARQLAKSNDYSDHPGLRLREIVFWRISSLFLLLLGINKQLDLQSLLTAIGRHFAKHDGWYERRRHIQFWFVISVAAFGVSLLAGVIWRLRRLKPRATFGAVGFIALMMFVVIRAASFHHVDTFLHSEAIGIKLNHVLELMGIGIVGASSAVAYRDSKPGVRSATRRGLRSSADRDFSSG